MVQHQNIYFMKWIVTSLCWRYAQVGDVGNDYPEAYTDKKIFFTSEKEFELMGHNGYTMLISK